MSGGVRSRNQQYANNNNNNNNNNDIELRSGGGAQSANNNNNRGGGWSNQGYAEEHEEEEEDMDMGSTKEFGGRRKEFEVRRNSGGGGGGGGGGERQVQITAHQQVIKTEKMEAQDPVSKLFRCFRGLWKTRLTEDTEDDRELYVRTTLRELGVYIGFITILCILTFGMTSGTMFYFTKVMKDLFVDSPKFGSLSTMSSFWGYAEGSLLNGLYWENYYNDKQVPKDKRGYIYFENKLLGVPRIRQVRVRNDSCSVHKDFSERIKECYAPYSPSVEDKTVLKEKINGTAWRYQTALMLQGTSFFGKHASYKGGGYAVELTRNKADSLKIIQSLKDNLWLDRGTRAVFIDFTVYNANINLFCIVTLAVEYPPTGGGFPFSKFRTLKLLRYVTTMDHFVLVCEMIFLLYLMYYSVEECIEMRKHGWVYFKNCWNILDVVVILMGVFVVIFNLYRVMEVDRLLKGMLKKEDTYANFEKLGHWQELFNDFIAVAVFLAWVKVFKYISFNKTMTQLQSTLTRCAKDVAGFSVMFFIIFFAYAQWGYLIFGSQVEGFSTYKDSIFTLFRIILGDFNFKEIEDANRILGPIFFMTYVFFVFFVLINMFLAIINDTYAEVKEELAQQESEFEIADYFKKGYGKMMNKLSFKREKIVDIQKALQSADANSDNKLDYDEWKRELKLRGHEDAEINAVFSKYDVDGDRILSTVERKLMEKDLENTKAELTEEIEEVERAQDENEVLRSKVSLRDGGDSEDDGDDDGGSVGGDASPQHRRRGGRGRGGIPPEEFAVLSRRVDRVEHSIGSIVSKIDAVLLKLEAMDKAKIKRREHMSKLLDSISEQGSQYGGGDDASSMHSGIDRWNEGGETMLKVPNKGSSSNSSRKSTKSKGTSRAGSTNGDTY